MNKDTVKVLQTFKTVVPNIISFITVKLFVSQVNYICKNADANGNPKSIVKLIKCTFKQIQFD
jgi:hypothetical protein